MSKNLTRRQKARLREAAAELHSRDEAFKKAANVDFWIYIVTMLLVLFALRAFVGEPVRVDGVSMYDTLADTERMVVEKVSYWFRTPKRGEIIICYYDYLKERCVKRVVGLPGETIEIRGGITYIDGEALQEDYIYAPMWQDMLPVVVPENTVFVMGDNRNESWDSRDQLNIGCIPYADIEGRVIAVMWPISAIRGVE